MQALVGIIAAPALPMLPDYSIDWNSLRRYICWVAEQRPAGIAMNMDASEGPSLSTEERVEVIREVRRLVDGACPVYSGLIAGWTREAVEHGCELKQAGAQGLAVFPPFPTFLGKPVPSEMVFEYHNAIAEGIGLPLIAFQFPKEWGPDYTPETLRRLANVPQVVGLKEASFDTPKTIETIDAVRSLPRKIGVLTGSDTFILEALIFGCDGALIGFAGTATGELVGMRESVVQRDYATAHEIWGRLGPLARYCWRPPLRDYRPRMKEVLHMQGLIQHTTTRPPQLGVDEAERTELRRLAVAAGLL